MYIVGSCFTVLSENLYLFNWSYQVYTFNVIINMVVFKSVFSVCSTCTFIPFFLCLFLNWTFRSVLFSFQIFRDFPDIFLLLISNSFPLQPENILWIFSNLVETCFMGYNMIFLVLGSPEKMCILLLFGVSLMPLIRPSELIVLFRHSNLWLQFVYPPSSRSFCLR